MFEDLLAELEIQQKQKIILTEDEKNDLINILNKCSGELHGWDSLGIHLTIEVPWE